MHPRHIEPSHLRRWSMTHCEHIEHKRKCNCVFNLHITTTWAELKPVARCQMVTVTVFSNCMVTSEKHWSQSTNKIQSLTVHTQV